MSQQKNLAFIFNKAPSGLPKPGEDLIVKDIGFDASQTPSDGIALKVLYSSLDPYLRGLLTPTPAKSYVSGFAIGDTIPNGSLAEVIESNNDQFKKGDIVQGRLPIQQFIAWSGEEAKALRKLDTTGGPEDLRHYLGALGMPGLTAYSSLYDIGQPKKGETIFISSAAGAVGQLVGQLAKREGLKVIGSVGTDDKLKYLTEIGFDGGFNYKKEKSLDALKRLAPDGIDIYYENVGGEQLQAALDVMKERGRIVACGMISQYNSTPEERYGVTNLINVVFKRITIRGFIVGDKDMGPVYYKEHQTNVRKWLADGSIKANVHEWSIEEADKGFVGMLQGENFGKAVVKVSS